MIAWEEATRLATQRILTKEEVMDTTEVVRKEDQWIVTKRHTSTEVMTNRQLQEELRLELSLGYKIVDRTPERIRLVSP